MNLDWIIKTVQDLKTEYASLLSSFDTLSETQTKRFAEIEKKIATLTEYVNGLEFPEIVGDRYPAMNETQSAEVVNHILMLITEWLTNARHIGYDENNNMIYEFPLHYGNHATNGGNSYSIWDFLVETVTNPVYDVVDCSSFVLSILSGISFLNTKYYNSSGRELNTCLFGNTIFRNYITPNNPNKTIRWTDDILRNAEYSMRMVPFNVDDYRQGDNLQTGDVVFWCWTDEYINSLDPDDPHNFFELHTYKHAAHCGIIIKTENYIDGKTQDKVYLAHVYNTDRLINLRTLYNYNQSLSENLYMYPYVFRPTYKNLPYRYGYTGFCAGRYLYDVGSFFYGSAITYGTKINTSSITIGSVISDGSAEEGNIDTDTTYRAVTNLIPFNRCCHIDTSELDSNYDILIACYSTAGTFIRKSSVDTFNSNETTGNRYNQNVKFIRIEFKHSDNSTTPFTPADIAAFSNVRVNFNGAEEEVNLQTLAHNNNLARPIYYSDQGSLITNLATPIYIRTEFAEIGIPYLLY